MRNEIGLRDVRAKSANLKVQKTKSCAHVEKRRFETLEAVPCAAFKEPGSTHRYGTSHTNISPF